MPLELNIVLPRKALAWNRCQHWQRRGPGAFGSSVCEAPGHFRGGPRETCSQPALGGSHRVLQVACRGAPQRLFSVCSLGRRAEHSLISWFFGFLTLSMTRAFWSFFVCLSAEMSCWTHGLAALLAAPHGHLIPQVTGSRSGLSNSESKAKDKYGNEIHLTFICRVGKQLCYLLKLSPSLTLELEENDHSCH